MNLKEHSLIVGRGSTAIYLALNRFDGGEVIVPSNVCYAAILPIFYSGNKPRFIDIEYPSGNASAEQVFAAITEKTVAVLYPHMYGNVASYDELCEIRDYCKSHGIILIEDCASAMGGAYENSMPAGSLGDYAVFSTGHSKNVDLGNGGILFSQTPLDEQKDLYTALPAFSASIEEMQDEIAHSYSKAKHANDDAVIADIFAKYDSYKRAFLYRVDDEQLIAKTSNSFNDANAVSAERKRKFDLFKNNLPEDICYQYSNNSLPWRFSILVDDVKVRQEIINELLANDLFVSDWYPCIGRFFDENGEFPNAERMEKEILNFTLLDDDDTILRICGIINSKFIR